MLKPSSLRSALLAAIPQFKANPDRLLVFVEAGSVRATAAASLSFEYAYTLNLVATDYEGHADALLVPLLAWVRIHQPELMLNPDLARDGIQFEAEILNHETADIAIKVKLTERVGVKEVAGGYDVTHYDEPPLDPDAGVTTWQYFLQGQPVTWPPTADDPLP